MQKLEAKSVASVSGVMHGFFGREMEVSPGLYTSLDCAVANQNGCEAAGARRLMADRLKPGVMLASLTQKHTPHVHLVGADWEADFHPEGDGMVTARPGIALGILTADCGPVLFIEPEARVIGAAHAGWKGAIGGVLEATVAAMQSLGAVRSRIIAAIGPCISMANYEVSDEFFHLFLAADSANERFFQAKQRGHYYFNLEGYITARLTALQLHTIEALKICTYPEANGFFSFRRATHVNESDCGRQMSAILLTK